MFLTPKIIEKCWQYCNEICSKAKSVYMYYVMFMIDFHIRGAYIELTLSAKRLCDVINHQL